MREMLAHADLDRYAGQFVWLELNYDSAQNRAFLTKYGASATPTFFVIDPLDGQVAATRTGAMSLLELTQFLDRGTSGVFAKRQTPADAALKRGDTLFTQKPEEAVSAYQEALRLAPAAWPRRDLAEASFVAALEATRQLQRCAEAAADKAAGMKRDSTFGRIVVAGLWCVNLGDPAPWSKVDGTRLEPLAKEALSLSTIVRDHRNELYRNLMYLSLARNDNVAAADWGSRWLDELDQIKPVDDDERSAVDIARVENIQVFGDPKRILPALIASEHAMPDNYNASLRVAQMESAAKNLDESIAACDRGLAREPGALGRSWLLQTKADALERKAQTKEARTVLEQALEAAQAIPNERSRENNIRRIKQALGEAAAGAQK